MPIYHNNILSVTTKELQECGLSAGYLKRALAGQRRGEVYCWEHHKEGKRVYIHYHSLKEKYQELIKKLLCDNMEPEVYLKQKDEDQAQATIDNLTDQVTSMVRTDPDELRELIDSQIYTPTEAHQLARAAGWLRIINEFDVKRVRKMGFESIATFRSEVFKRCLNEQQSEPGKAPLIKFKKGMITSERVLYRNASQYKKSGIKALMHAGTGNVNREKGDAVAHAKLIDLASNQVKYSWEDVAMMFNDWAIENNKEQLTTSTIKKYLNTPKIKKVWFYNRHGKHAADNELQPLINRDKPSFPDALWSLDGTTMQLYYVDESGKIRSDLYVYFVTDANTGAILGHAVAFAETAGLVEAALRDAIHKYGYRPYQLQYDNSSANQARVIQKLYTNMSRVHFPCEPYKGRSKYVEGIIGHFQMRVLRKRENFKGGNVTSGSLNSKANPELLAQLRKNPEQLPDMNQVLVEFKEGVTEWNDRGEKRDSYGRFVGESKINRYTAIQHEKRCQLNYFDKISLFFIEQPEPYTYGTNGIEIERKGVKRHYIVPDNDGTVGDFMFANEHMGEKFTIRMDRDNPEMIVLYQNDKVIAEAYEKERYAAAVADMKEGEKGKQVQFKQKQEQYGYEYAVRELEKQRALLGEIRATGTDGFGWWDTSKANENARESALEDVSNGMSDGLTERQRRILQIGK